MRNKLLILGLVIPILVGVVPCNPASQDSGTAYAVVGPVDVSVVNKEGESVPGCTFKITDRQTGEVVDEGESDDRGGIYLWVPDDGSYSVEVFRDGQKVTESDIDLAGGPKGIEVDVDRKTVTPRDIFFLRDARIGITSGVKIQDGASELDRASPLFGVYVSVPLFPIGDLFIVRGRLGYSASPTNLDNDNLTQIVGGPSPTTDPLVDMFDVLRFDGTGLVQRATLGFSLEHPLECGCIPFIFFGFEYTHFGFEKDTVTTTRTFPEQPLNRDIRDASKDAVGFKLEAGALKDLPWHPAGRHTYAGFGVGIEGTDTDFSRGYNTFRIEPFFNAHFAINPFSR